MPCGLRFEKLLWSKGVSLVAGIDEAGRGPLAGPVVAAVAVLPAKFSLPGLNDSKQLTEEFRWELFEALTATGVLVCYGIGIAEPAEINRFNHSSGPPFWQCRERSRLYRCSRSIFWSMVFRFLCSNTRKPRSWGETENQRASLRPA